MNRTDTITAKELIAALKLFPADTKIYMSRDAEGNGYNSIDKEDIGEHSEMDKALTIFPNAEHLEYDEIMPKKWEAESDE